MPQAATENNERITRRDAPAMIFDFGMILRTRWYVESSLVWVWLRSGSGLAKVGCTRKSGQLLPNSYSWLQRDDDSRRLRRIYTKIFRMYVLSKKSLSRCIEIKIFVVAASRIIILFFEDAYYYYIGTASSLKDALQNLESKSMAHLCVFNFLTSCSSLTGVVRSLKWRWVFSAAVSFFLLSV